MIESVALADLSQYYSSRPCERNTGHFIKNNFCKVLVVATLGIHHLQTIKNA